MNVLDAVSKNPYGFQSIGLKLNVLARKAGLSPVAVSGSWQILPSSHFTEIGYHDPIPAPMVRQTIDLGLTTQAEVDGLDRASENGSRTLMPSTPSLGSS